MSRTDITFLGGLAIFITGFIFLMTTLIEQERENAAICAAHRMIAVDSYCVDPNNRIENLKGGDHD